MARILNADCCYSGIFFIRELILSGPWSELINDCQVECVLYSAITVSINAVLESGFGTIIN